MLDLKNELNWNEAIEYLEGPLLIIAGPGSGKTYTLIEKISKTISISNPKGLIICTFTRKATEELKDRLYSKIGLEKLTKHRIIIGTIHSIAYKLLKEYFDGKYSDFEILTEDKQISYIKSKLVNFGFSNEEIKGFKSWKLSEDLSQIFSYISDQKLDISKLNIDDDDLMELVSKYNLYKKILFKDRLIDFALIQKLLLDELTLNPLVLSNIQNDYSSFFIDEYQDVNNIQNEIFNLISNRSKLLTVVGDDNQSIYGFRGANSNLIKQFYHTSINHFGSCKFLKLEKNYRSTHKIVSFSNAFIENSKGNRFAKKLSSARSFSGNDPKILVFESDIEEAKYITSLIKTAVADKRMDYSDVCVLFKSVKNHSTALRISLFEEKIPFDLIGAGNLFDQPIGFELLTTLDYLLSKDDNPIDELLSTFNDFDDLNFTNIASDYSDTSMLESLFNIKKNLYKYRSCLGLFYDILEKQHWLSRYSNNGEDIGEISGTIESFDRFSNLFDPFGLYSYLYYLAQNQKMDVFRKNNNSVNLMTIHQSKGLEFPLVILASQNRRSKNKKSNLDKLKKTTGFKDDLNEENRLVYVGMTRAIDELFVTCSRALKSSSKKYDPNKQASLLIKLNKISDKDVLPNILIKNRTNKKKEKELLTLSYNKIKLYQICPLQYKFQNKWNLKTLRVGGMIYGTNVHRLIEVLLNQVSQNNISAENFDIDKHMSDYWNGNIYNSRSESDKFAKIASKQISFFIKKYGNILHPDNIFSVEEDFNFFDGNMLVNGRMDAIFKLGKKNVIIDFKTGDERDYSEQLNFYNYCFKEKYGYEADELRVYFLKTGNTSIIPNKGYNKEIKLVKHIGSKIQKELFPPNPGKQCGNCAYNKICEFKL